MPNQSAGLKLSLKAIFDFSGKSISTVTKFDDFQLKEDESELLATQTDLVIFEFFPTINSKVGKLLSLICSFIAVFGGKWIMYEKHLSKKQKEVKTDNNEKKENPDKVFHQPIVLDGFENNFKGNI